MQSIHPATFYPELSDDRLRIIASKLLDVRFNAIRELDSPFDDNYTRECTVFGRSRNMLVDMAKQNEYRPWMGIKHAGMDVTFNIERVVCRFFRDDVQNPEKAGFFKRNSVDCLFDTDDKIPVVWRFVIERALTEDDEDRVFFIGFNAFHEKVSQWMYQGSAPTLHAVDQDVPEAADMSPAPIEIRDDEVANNELDNNLEVKSDDVGQDDNLKNGLR